MTYDQEIGEEAAAIFQALFMGETVQVSKKSSGSAKLSSEPIT